MVNSWYSLALHQILCTLSSNIVRYGMSHDPWEVVFLHLSPSFILLLLFLTHIHPFHSCPIYTHINPSHTSLSTHASTHASTGVSKPISTHASTRFHTCFHRPPLQPPALFELTECKGLGCICWFTALDALAKH